MSVFVRYFTESHVIDSLGYQRTKLSVYAHGPAHQSFQPTSPVSCMHAGHVFSLSVQQLSHYNVQTATAVISYLSSLTLSILFLSQMDTHYHTSEMQSYHCSITTVYSKSAVVKYSDPFR